MPRPAPPRRDDDDSATRPLGLLGLVAVCTPFHGSPLAGLFFVPSIRAFLPDDETIVMLGSEQSVNGRIVSVFGRFDPHIPDGSALDGATNVLVPASGHFRVLGSRADALRRHRRGADAVRRRARGVNTAQTVRPPAHPGGALSRQRVVLGFVVALVGGPLLTWLLYSFRTPESITSEVLAFQLLVVIVALVGGIWPALFAAVLSGLTLDFLFVAPQFTVAISDPLHLWALFLYVVIAILVSYIVDQAARRARVADRATAEAELLASVAGSVLRGQSAVPALVSRTREAFGSAGVRLVDADGTVIATDGEPVRDGRFTAVPVGDKAHPRAILELHGAPLHASERRLLDVIVAQLGGALERTDLTETAREAGALAEMDQVRTALLSAVSHDLRRPLAAAVAAIGGLRAAGREPLRSGPRASCSRPPTRASRPSRRS